MKNSINRILSIFLITFIVFSTFYNVFASDLKTSLDIIQKASETKYLENDQGFISKTIVDSNANSGEVTIELKLSNTKKEVAKSNDTEIILVIDNSGSMDYKTAEGKSRKSILLDSSRSLVNSVFDTSTNVKMGVVKFCGETGLWAPLYAASVITKPTSKREDVLSGLTTIENKSTESGTNIQKGLIKAEELFSESSGNKIIILLTDGCPNEDGEKNNVGNSQMVMSNEKYNTILSNTKNELINIKKKGIRLISLMTGVNSNDVDKDGNVITNTEDDLQAIKTIFGTEDNPTAGKFYNAKTTDISQVIKNDITKDVQEILNTPLNTVKVTDYFPKDITNNFEFSYVGNPSIGTASDDIDNQTNTIEWNIGTLKGDEVATLKYKLKIKDMKNEQLLNKTLSTNEKVVLTYKDTDSNDYTVTLSSSPKIQLSELKEDLTATISYDPTTETTQTVQAIIKTNKKVNEVEGWTLSEDGKTLTKTYSTNVTETVHLVDLDNMTKDILVTINNIKSVNSDNDNNKFDKTIATGKLPQAGVDITIIFVILLTVVICLITYKKYNSYKDIK